MSFKLKTILGIAVIEALLLGVLIGSNLRFLHNTHVVEITKRAHTTATLFATTTKEAVLSTDLASLESFVDEVMKNRQIVYARVMDANGKVLAERGDAEALARPFRADKNLDHIIGKVYNTYADIHVGKEHYGRVEVGLSVAGHDNAMGEARRYSTLIAMTEMLLTALFSTLLGFYLTRQLKSLREGAERITHYEFGYQIPVRGRDELAETALAFNVMSQRLAELDEQRDRAEAEIRQLNAKLQRKVEHSDQKLQEVSAELKDASRRDPLTGLPNRQHFYMLLNAVLHGDYVEDRPFALVYVSIVDFKGLNLVMGHDAGDSIILQIVHRLHECLRENDVVARVSGDTFAILSPAVSNKALDRLLDKISDTLKPRYNIDEDGVLLRTCIGAVLGRHKQENLEKLLHSVQTAVEQARHKPDARHIARPEVERDGVASLFLPRDLPPAIYGDQLTLHYQPKFSLAERRVTGVEALIRWHHPRLGMLPPDKFIAATEETSMIHMLTLWVLEQSLSQLAQWRRSGANLHMAVNLSPTFLQHHALPQQIERLLQDWQLPGEALTLEITESAMLADPLQAHTVLQQLSLLGVNIAIDDFGTGYSSLTYLKQLPVSELKIDKSFVHGLEHDTGNQTIVRSVIDLAHNLGMNVVAEGVESMPAFRLLESLHCDLLQGYFIGRPQAGDDAARSFIFPARTG